MEPLTLRNPHLADGGGEVQTETHRSLSATHIPSTYPFLDGAGMGATLYLI